MNHSHQISQGDPHNLDDRRDTYQPPGNIFHNNVKVNSVQ